MQQQSRKFSSEGQIGVQFEAIFLCGLNLDRIFYLCDPEPRVCALLLNILATFFVEFAKKIICDHPIMMMNNTLTSLSTTTWSTFCHHFRCLHLGLLRFLCRLQNRQKKITLILQPNHCYYGHTSYISTTDLSCSLNLLLLLWSCLLLGSSRTTLNKINLLGHHNPFTLWPALFGLS